MCRLKRSVPENARSKKRAIPKHRDRALKEKAKGDPVPVLNSSMLWLVPTFVAWFCLVSTSRGDGTEGSLTPSPDLVSQPASQPASVWHGAGDFKIMESDGAAGKHKYSIFIPGGYQSSKTYPAIVFLHGMGEQGNDGQKCRTVGLGPAIERRRNDFPLIAIFPQDGGDWTTDNSEKIMLDAIADAQKHFSIDKDRIALTGLSTGGKGVWVQGAKHPEIFSCLVPVAAQKAEDQIPKLTHYPIWAFQNDHDPFVNPDETRAMINKLQSAGANPKVTFYPSGDHDCWDAAYGEQELYSWIMAQHRHT
jgi:predicted peptidase